MKHAHVRIPWEEGLHLRPAAQVVKCTRGFSSQVRLRVGDNFADARNILTILLLAATCGTALAVEATGEDEDEALASVVSIFEQADVPSGINGPS